MKTVGEEGGINVGIRRLTTHPFPGKAMLLLLLARRINEVPPTDLLYVSQVSTSTSYILAHHTSLLSGLYWTSQITIQITEIAFSLYPMYLALPPQVLYISPRSLFQILSILPMHARLSPSSFFSQDILFLFNGKPGLPTVFYFLYS